MSEGKEDATGTPFTLKNVGSGFEGRSSDIFGKLDVLERQHISHEQSRTDLECFADLRQDDDDDDLVDRTSTEKTRPDAERQGKNTLQQGNGDSCSNPGDMLENAETDASSSKKSDSGSSFKRGGKRAGQSDARPPLKQDAQFRRPSGRPPGRNLGRRGRVPDHGKKPQTWTHYSLEDVKGSDMSEKSNAQAALAFLEDRRKLRETQEEMSVEEEDAFDVGSAACSKGMFSFAKRTKTDKSSNTQDKLGEDQSVASEQDKSDKDRSSAAVVDLATSDTGTEGEETLEKETMDSSSSKEDRVKAGFKSRKGIKRNIRARDDD